MIEDGLGIFVWPSVACDADGGISILKNLEGIVLLRTFQAALVLQTGKGLHRETSIGKNVHVWWRRNSEECATPRCLDGQPRRHRPWRKKTQREGLIGQNMSSYEWRALSGARYNLGADYPGRSRLSFKPHVHPFTVSRAQAIFTSTESFPSAAAVTCALRST